MVVVVGEAVVNRFLPRVPRLGVTLLRLLVRVRGEVGCGEEVGRVLGALVMAGRGVEDEGKVVGTGDVKRVLGKVGEEPVVVCRGDVEGGREGKGVGEGDIKRVFGKIGEDPVVVCRGDVEGGSEEKGIGDNVVKSVLGKIGEEAVVEGGSEGKGVGEGDVMKPLGRLLRESVVGCLVEVAAGGNEAKVPGDDVKGVLGTRKDDGEVVKGMNVEGVEGGKVEELEKGDGVLGRRKEERGVN